MYSRESALENVQLPLRLAPASLYRPILPGWQFNLFSVNLVAEALEVVIEQLKLLDALQVFLGDVSQARGLKVKRLAA